jgi:hypothetical protein
MIKNLMQQGKLVPSVIIVKLLLKAMLRSGGDRLLVDGFPRNEENRRAYDKIVRSSSGYPLSVFFFKQDNSCLQINMEPEFTLFIDCPKEELERRVLSRNQVLSACSCDLPDVVIGVSIFHHFWRREGMMTTSTLSGGGSKCSRRQLCRWSSTTRKGASFEG